MDIFYDTPFYGVPRLTAELKRRGFNINHKRVRRLQKALGLQTIYPRPHFNTSAPPSGTQEVSVPLERLGNRSSESGMEYGYYLYRSQRTSGFCYCY